MTTPNSKVGKKMRLFWLTLLLASAGCANNTHDECGDKFLLLWPTAANDYSFQEVHLSTLKSAYEVRGSAAEVYVESRITDSGFEGKPARPRLTRSSGGLCVPMDVTSSMALTAYAHFEHIQKFDQKLQVDKQISWPRKVGVEIHIRAGEGHTHNNAHYFSKADAVAVIPYNNDGLPLGLNPGVLAHEHFHSHFQAQVINPLNDAIDILTSVEQFFYAGFGVKPQVEDLDNEQLNTAGSLNKFVVRSWNEGLADFYASVYTDSREFFSKSLANLASVRDLGGPLRGFKSGAELVGQAGQNLPVAASTESMRQARRRNMVGTSYQQGTLLARLMYRVAQSGSVSPRDLLQRVLTRLSRVPSLVSPQFHARVIDFEEIVPVLLEGQTLNAVACESMKQALSKPILLRSFPQCGL